MLFHSLTLPHPFYFTSPSRHNKHCIAMSSSSSCIVLQHHLRASSPPPMILCRGIVQTPPQFHLRKQTYRISASSFSSSSSSSWEREEARWVREEQRWLREENRWLREESRWNTERQSLLNEIATLRAKIQALELHKLSSSSSSSSATDFPPQLSSLPERNQIAESGTGSIPLLIESEEEEAKEEVNKEIGVNEVRVVVEQQTVAANKTKRIKGTLRKGAEGEEVRKMQEALLKLGFYSGEEDMEFSSFSTDTERAVKTWQASLGSPEDGIMTDKLLEILFGEDASLNASADRTEKDGANEDPAVSTIKVSKLEKIIVEENDITKHRVFLLGENRWEDSSRLTGKYKQGGSKVEVNGIKCLTCRGEGHLSCLECDGTGEPNIEEQFLEWVDEDMKCPYCEGRGYTICDVCEGKVIIKT